VSRVKPRLIGSSEESISILQMASVSIRTGLIWADIRIESTGGTDPIVSHGHRKGDTRDSRLDREIPAGSRQALAGSV